MVKYQFTSQDVEQQIDQIARLQEIMEKQAKIIEKLENQNDDLRLQVQKKIAEQLEKKQCNQQTTSDLLELEDEKQNKDGSKIQQQKIEIDFVQNQKDLFHVNIENSYLYLNKGLFNDLNLKLNNIKDDGDKNTNKEQKIKFEQYKLSDGFFGNQQYSQTETQSNGFTSSLVQNNIQQNQNKINLLSMNENSTLPFFVCSQSNNIFDLPQKHQSLSQQSNILEINQSQQQQNNVSQNEIQKQQIIMETEDEQEPLLFGDPQSIFFNNLKIDQNKQLIKTQQNEEFCQNSQIKENQEAQPLQNLKDVQSQIKTSSKFNSNEELEDFQIQEKSQESISN